MEIDYEKEYTEALERAKRLRDSKYQTMNAKRVAEEIFPVLAESEDERMRKAALEGIEYLERDCGWDVIGDIDILDVKEYLEKQKELPTNEEMLRTLRAEYEKGVADTIAKYEEKEQIIDSAPLYTIEQVDEKVREAQEWKPSKEQMEALNALNCHGDLSYVGQQNQLVSLYNDLKKLI